jgi:hypothetical protein
MGAPLAVNQVYTGDALELMDRLEPWSLEAHISALRPFTRRRFIWGVGAPEWT